MNGRPCSIRAGQAHIRWIFRDCYRDPKQCRAERIEPPGPGRITRIVRSALHNAEETWFAKIAARLDAETTGRVLALVGAAVSGTRRPSWPLPIIRTASSGSWWSSGRTEDGEAVEAAYFRLTVNAGWP
ncbi:hypothetical protein [Streptosporangium sp. LJ11]|uniref:hypothetical protein n=1 Tax=Streptosporangium sp. LJ11 TaxID=3436927 RepID=UPI003F79A274